MILRNKTYHFLFPLLMLHAFLAKGQNFSCQNKVYSPNIKTIECYNSSKEQSYPIISLNSAETLIIGFDDLQGGSKNYSFTIEHCTYDWKSSMLNRLDYIDGLSESNIFNYQYSFNTLQKFTHYQFTFPNEQLKPKIAGNYILKVYENGHSNSPVFTQQFYVVSNTLSIGGELVTSSEVSNRNTKQKVNFTIFNRFTIQNPSTDVKVVVMQNFIPQTAKLNTKPRFNKQTSLVYNDLNANEFWGGNEFRKFDFRSFRYKPTGVAQIYTDSLKNVVLQTDLLQDKVKYVNSIDDNGTFFIRNNDGRNNVTDSDYAWVLFTLNAPKPSNNGHAYVVGRFNNYTISDENKLSYESSRRRFYGNIKLKQGVYDYKYVWVDDTGAFNDTVFEASFFETENNYLILVYYRKPGSRFDELAAYASISSLKK